VAGVSDDEEEATARTLAARRFAALAGVPAEARYRRVAQLLARRGYPPTLIGRVLRDVAAASLDTGDGHDVESLDDGE
jgi:regulatory protein